MQTIVFATNNAHKLEEVRSILSGRMQVLSLADIGCHEDIPETASTLRGNAGIKACYVRDKYGYDCFADDTGLMVDALNGEPGVRSARYAPGEGHDSQANMRLLLSNLEGVDDRKAHFATVIALATSRGVEYFEGRVDGVITCTPAGNSGFGYDPIFMPDGYTLTFAQMDESEKNAISHRRRATDRLLDYLTSNTLL